MTRGEHIMWTMGSDFNYENAETWFINMDRLIESVNADGRIQMKYSSPAEYVAAKRSESHVTWPVTTGDFFPYADGPHQFWSGYFTSRPALKGYVRRRLHFSGQFAWRRAQHWQNLGLANANHLPFRLRRHLWRRLQRLWVSRSITMQLVGLQSNTSLLTMPGVLPEELRAPRRYSAMRFPRCAVMKLESTR